MATIIQRPVPVRKRQSLKDSCWAAVLTAWSWADMRLRGEGGSMLDEISLIKEFGSGPTGGLPTEERFPELCRRYGLEGDGYRAERLWTYLQDHLPQGYVFCSHQRPPGSHALLIYKLDIDADQIHFMDPDGGHLRKEKNAFFDTRGPLVLAHYIGKTYKGRD